MAVAYFLINCQHAHLCASVYVGQARSAGYHAKCRGSTELRSVVSDCGVPKPRHQAGRQEHEDPSLP